MGELSGVGKILEYISEGGPGSGRKPEGGSQRFDTIQGRYNTLKGRMQTIKKWAPWRKKGYNLKKELSFPAHAEFVQQKSSQYMRVARRIGRGMSGLKISGFVQKKSKWSNENMAEIGKILEYGVQGMKWGTSIPPATSAHISRQAKGNPKKYRELVARFPIKLKPGEYKNRTGQIRSMGRPPRGTKLMGSGRNWSASFSKTINTYNKRRSADKGMYEGGPGSGRKSGGTHVDQGKVMRRDRAIMMKGFRKQKGTKRTLWAFMRDSQKRFPKLAAAMEQFGG